MTYNDYKDLEFDMRNLIITSFLVCGIGAAASAHELDEAEIKRLVIEAILEQPDVVFDAISIVQQRQQDELLARASSTENAAVFGDPNAPIAIIEFFDYNCGFCKRAASVVRSAMSSNPDVKVVMREFPILSEGSLFAARAALAAREQGKYEELHWALMDVPQVTEATTIAAAEELGLDIDKLRADMELEAVQSHIATSRSLADGLNITGTPAFLVGDQMVPGYVDEDQINRLIEDIRS